MFIKDLQNKELWNTLSTVSQAMELANQRAAELSPWLTLETNIQNEQDKQGKTFFLSINSQLGKWVTQVGAAVGTWIYKQKDTTKPMHSNDWKQTVVPQWGNKWESEVSSMQDRLCLQVISEKPKMGLNRVQFSSVRSVIVKACGPEWSLPTKTCWIKTLKIEIKDI